MRPLLDLSASDRQRWRKLKLTRLEVLPAGRVMFSQGRKTLGFANIEKMGAVSAIPAGADTICVAPSDFDDVRIWRDGD